MKKISISIFCFFAFVVTNAQDKGDVKYIPCASFGISVAVRDLPDAPEVEPSEASESKDNHERRKINAVVNQNALPQVEDEAWQKMQGTKSMSNPIVNFDGQSVAGMYPLDPSGAAGPNHYVQAVNTQYRVYNKSGAALISAKQLSTLWAGSADDGDPIVLYDKFADRWFIQQFQSSDNSILIAISTTADPTGTYYKYKFIPAASDFPDYPKFAIWSDGYYMSSNYNTSRIAVFDRAKMIAGNSSAGMIVKTLPSVISGGFYCPLPADADGQLPPSGTPCPIFTYEDDSWGAPADRLKIWEMKVDWTTPSNTTLTVKQTLDAVPFDAASFNVNWNDVAQPGTTKKLDAIAGVLNYRAQYRRWTTYNSVVVCHAVKVTTTQIGIRWYELRQDESSKTWSIYQQGTYAPDGYNRWLGSIAMDDNGSIAMAYNVSGATTIYPSLYYTGRLASDPLGQFTFAEKLAKAGTSSQSVNRDGDYSQTVLDPDGLTFWHTGTYVSGGLKTRIFSWQISLTSGIEEKENQAALSTYQSNNELHITATKLPSNDAFVVDLFDISGKKISGKKIVPTSNMFETTIDVNGLANGVYLIRVGNENFQRVVKVSIN